MVFSLNKADVINILASEGYAGVNDLCKEGIFEFV